MASRIPSFNISGVVSDMRELKTKEGKVWAYSVKVMALGGTFELQTQDEKIFKQFGPGQEGEAVGHFDNFKGWRFIVEQWKPAKAA